MTTAYFLYCCRLAIEDAAKNRIIAVKELNSMHGFNAPIENKHDRDHKQMEQTRDNKMNDIILPGPTEQKMSSVEIAELMNKQHKNVVRDIRSLIEQEAITWLNFELSEYKDASGKANTMYLLDFEATTAINRPGDISIDRSRLVNACYPTN